MPNLSCVFNIRIFNDKVIIGKSSRCHLGPLKHLRYTFRRMRNYDIDNDDDDWSSVRNG